MRVAVSNGTGLYLMIQGGRYREKTEDGYLITSVEALQDGN